MLPAIPKPIPMPFAQNGERREIPETNTTPGSADASWATGFPPVTRINKQAGGKPPYGLDFQGLFHTICEHLFFSQSGNTPPWVGASEGQPGLNYLKGAVVQGGDGVPYMALKPSGPDVPNPDGAGFVGPVDPVGDESGHWISLQLMFGGGHNDMQIITESGEWTASVTGWHFAELIAGGNGGVVFKPSTNNYNAYGGAGGRRLTKFVYLTAGESVDVVIGAGGVGYNRGTGATPSTGAENGGTTSFGDISTENSGAYGYPTHFATNTLPSVRAFGTGPGGGASWQPGLYYGAGGGAGWTGENSVGFYDGGQGAVFLYFHNPAKAAGPVPVPALFAARRVAADGPATVRLYDPATGQGSVWREEDAEAKLAEGLITEAAWLELCAQKAAEDRDEWLASPDTEAERFEMLRAARDAKLAATDYLVAPDYPLTGEQRAAVTAYRQALRDLPAQEGAPWDGGGEATPWPEEPAVGNVQEEE